MSIDHRAIAVATYNRCWELLELQSPTTEHHTELLTCALTSRYHWLEAGGPEQWVISDWMVARAAGATGFGDLAVRFALRAEAALTGDLADWLRASVAEGVARAYRDADHEAERLDWIRIADERLSGIADDEDRALIASQLDEVR
jgi:hypothetical protein